MHADLSQWVSLQAIHTMLVFMRIGTAFLLLPGLGEPALPPRLRIAAALAVAIAAAPALRNLPSTMPHFSQLVADVIAEGITGALLGGLARTLVSAIISAGEFIGNSTGLNNVFVLGLEREQSASLGAFVYTGFLALFFAMDGHHLLIRTLVESYRLFPPAQFPRFLGGAQALAEAGARALRLAAQLALPFLLLGLVFHISLAAINRAVPGMPVFMIGSPVLVLAALYLLIACIPGMLDQGILAAVDISPLLR
jgi:flagellar biosynthetic protein FliR